MAAAEAVPNIPDIDFKFSTCRKKERRGIFSAVIKFKYESEKGRQFLHPYDGLKNFHTKIERDIGIFPLFPPINFLLIYLFIFSSF